MTETRKDRYDIGALEQRVYGVEKAISDISNAISALSTKIDERSRTPWATLISTGGFALALITAVGVLAYTPVQSELARHEEMLNKIQDRYIDGLRRQIDMLHREAQRKAAS